MKLEDLSEGQKNKIIDLCVNTTDSFQEISETTNVPVVLVYDVFRLYCEENGYKNVIRSKNGLKYEKEKIK